MTRTHNNRPAALTTGGDMTEEQLTAALGSSFPPFSGSSGTASLPVNLAAAERNSWTMRDWEKKDPKGLLQMKKLQSQRYEQLFNNFYVNSTNK